jgi:hypothetical protein
MVHDALFSSAQGMPNPKVGTIREKMHRLMSRNHECATAERPALYSGHALFAQFCMTSPASELLPLRDALQHAADLARRFEKDTAVIYRQSSPSIDAHQLCVRLASEAPPTNAVILTTVRRKPSAGPILTVALAAWYVSENLPYGVSLASRMWIELTPARGAGTRGAEFAYQFMSTEGLNVATWIPSMTAGDQRHVTMQPGHEGRGRVYSPPEGFGRVEAGDITGILHGMNLRAAEEEESEDPPAPGN